MKNVIGFADGVYGVGAILDDDRIICEECDKEFLESYLLNKFNKSVCDNCRSSSVICIFVLTHSRHHTSLFLLLVCFSARLIS